MGQNDWTKLPEDFWLGLLADCLDKRIPFERINKAADECKAAAKAYLAAHPNVVAEAIEKGRETGVTQAGAIGAIVGLLKPPFYEWAKRYIPDLMGMARSPYDGFD